MHGSAQMIVSPGKSEWIIIYCIVSSHRRIVIEMYLMCELICFWFLYCCFMPWNHRLPKHIHATWMLLFRFCLSKSQHWQKLICWSPLRSFVVCLSFHFLFRLHNRPENTLTKCARTWCTFSILDQDSIVALNAIIYDKKLAFFEQIVRAFDEHKHLDTYGLGWH